MIVNFYLFVRKLLNFFIKASSFYTKNSSIQVFNKSSFSFFTITSRFDHVDTRHLIYRIIITFFVPRLNLANRILQNVQKPFANFIINCNKLLDAFTGQVLNANDVSINVIPKSSIYCICNLIEDLVNLAIVRLWWSTLRLVAIYIGLKYTWWRDKLSWAILVISFKCSPSSLTFIIALCWWPCSPNGTLLYCSKSLIKELIATLNFLFSFISLFTVYVIASIIDELIAHSVKQVLGKCRTFWMFISYLWVSGALKTLIKLIIVIKFFIV